MYFTLLRFAGLSLSHLSKHKSKHSFEVSLDLFFDCGSGGRFPPEVFLQEGVLKICSKFTGEHSCRSVISITLLCNFIEIRLWQGCSPVNLLHIFRTPCYKNTYMRNLKQIIINYFTSAFS